MILMNTLKKLGLFIREQAFLFFCELVIKTNNIHGKGYEEKSEGIQWRIQLWLDH
jgi:hypothetical protein